MEYVTCDNFGSDVSKIIIYIDLMSMYQSIQGARNPVFTKPSFPNVNRAKSTKIVLKKCISVEQDSCFSNDLFPLPIIITNF